MTVVPLPPPRTADDVLLNLVGELTTVVVVGWSEDGDAPAVIRSNVNAFHANWLLDCGKARLMSAGGDD